MSKNPGTEKERPQLQIALDVWSLKDALAILNDVAPYVDIIEAGTPLVATVGIDALSTIKEMYPDKLLVIDAKIADEHYIAARAFGAGADATTVLGALSDDNVVAALNEGRRAGKEVMVDLMNVGDKLTRAKRLQELGAGCVIVHCGLDEQRHRKTPLDDLKLLKQHTNLRVAAAGGINLETIDQYITAGADTIIVGGALVESSDRARIAKAMRARISRS